jgi:hypothetical protein
MPVDQVPRDEVLTEAPCYMDRFVKAALEIKLHLNNFSTGKGFRLSKAWNPSTQTHRGQENSKLQRKKKN